MTELGKLAIATLIWLAIIASSNTTAQAKPQADPTQAKTLTGALETWTLENGLEVAFVRTRWAPALAVQVWYRVGSKNEPSNRRGTAHMFEHLMFKGSAKVPPDAHAEQLRSIGGYSNAITTEDGTAYHNTVPKDQLNYVLALEADRMRSLVFDTNTIGAQRNLIISEIQRNLRSPLYQAVVRFLPLAFPNHPYSWTSGGALGDLGRIDTTSLTKFYNTNYVPNNALIVVVGDLDRATVENAVAKHFNKLERGPTIAQPKAPSPLTGQRKTGPSGQLGFALAGYRIPGAASPDIYPIQLLSLILSRGKDSRLFRKLVETKLAVEAGGQAIVRQQPGVFMVFAAFSDPANGDKAEATLLAEMKNIASQGVSASELRRAIVQAQAALGFAVQSIDGLAQQIGTSWVQSGEPGHFANDLDHFAAVSLSDIKAAAKKYFTENNRVVVRLPIAKQKTKQK